MALRLITYGYLRYKWTTAASTAADTIGAGRMPFDGRWSVAIHFPSLAAGVTAGAGVVMTEIR